MFIFNKSALLCRFLNISSAFFLFTFSCLLTFCIRKYSTEFYYNLGGFDHIIGIRFKLDNFSALIIFMTSFLHLLNTLLQNVKNDVKSIDVPKVGFVNILIAGVVGMLMTDDLFNMYVFLEISSIASYILAVNKWNKNSYFGAFDYLMIGAVASAFILLGIGFTYANFGTLNISEIFKLTTDMTVYGDLINYSAIFCIFGFLIKSGIFPFHSWYVQMFKTSSPSTLAIFTYGVSSAAIAMIVKLLYMMYGMQFLTSSTNYLLGILTMISILSIIFASFKAIKCKTFSEILGYSSIAQCGYLMIGFLSDNSIVFTGAIMQMFANGISKVAILRIYQRMTYASSLGAVPVDSIGRFDFSGVRMPIVIALLNLAGLPLTIGFIAKIYMIVGFVSEVKIVALLAIIISSILSLIYIFRIVEGVIIGNKPGVATEVEFHRVQTRSYERLIFVLIACFIIVIPFIKPFNQYLQLTTQYILNYSSFNIV